MIATKCILKTPEEQDGIRISVMSRHTLNDGVTPDSRITQSSYYLWHMELAPPAKLLGDYYKRGLSWEDFEKSYLKYIRQPTTADMIYNLAKSGLVKIITLMCIEETPDKCHRRLLAEECKRYFPELEIKHR